MEINKYLTTRNFNKGTSKQNKYIILHYTANNGDTAKSNCIYFKDEYRGASAHYFVDENSVYQCVEDSNIAWHIGANQYYTAARNSNSIGIEMCSRKDAQGNYYIKDEVVNKAVELTKYLMIKYGIPIENVLRHYDCTHKICPAPWVKDESKWIKFKERLADKMYDNEYEALDYLVSKGRINDKEYWLKAIEVVKNLKYLIIKWANDVK